MVVIMYCAKNGKANLDAIWDGGLGGPWFTERCIISGYRSTRGKGHIFGENVVAQCNKWAVQPLPKLVTDFLFYYDVYIVYNEMVWSVVNTIEENLSSYCRCPDCQRKWAVDV